MNTCTRVSLDCMPRSGTAGSLGMHSFSLSTWGRAQESSEQEAPGCLLPVESWAALAPLRNNEHDNTHEALTTREACLSLDVQRFLGLDTETWSTAYMANFASKQLLRGLSWYHVAQGHSHQFIISIDSLVWPRSPGKQRHSYQVEHSKSIEVMSQKPRAKARSLFRWGWFFTT